MRLDCFLSKQAAYSRRSVLQLISQRQIRVDGVLVSNREHPVTSFSRIDVSGKPVTLSQAARYFMLNKPAGYLSATTDKQHPVALELLKGVEQQGLHIAGRLDRATTGLLIMTDDGKWSRKLTEPKQKIPKTYLVETAYALSPETPQRFAEGIYFGYEKMTTSPALIELLGESSARLTIYEGRYHQVKRMFAAVGNRVVNLHRESMGEISLDSKLKLGEFRALTIQEIDSLN
ncbi:MAG: pseudouridine synthase [Pseudomonadota bacterium]